MRFPTPPLPLPYNLLTLFPMFFLLLLLTLPSTTSLTLTCHPQSQPNPIAKTYPNDVTGTINGTTAIVPIPYSLARRILPTQYTILTRAYESLIPSLPTGMFPAEIEAVLDHDVQMDGIGIPDFQRLALRLPFVDRLGDNHTCFKYTLPQLISTANPVALGGSIFYGATVPGTFDPPCDGYASGDGGLTAYLTGYVAPGGKGLNSAPAVDTRFRREDSRASPYSIEVFKNITNQPSFSSGVPLCDNYITLYNSSVTTGAYSPTPVRGNVTVAGMPFFPYPTTFRDVWGLRMDNAFIERNGKVCESLRGYGGTGSGD